MDFVLFDTFVLAANPANTFVLVCFIATHYFHFSFSFFLQSFKTKIYELLFLFGQDMNYY